jgi:hypothetical protein
MARFPAPITVIAGMTFTGFLLMVIICYYTVQEQSEWGFHHVSEFLAAAYGVSPFPNHYLMFATLSFTNVEFITMFPFWLIE